MKRKVSRTRIGPDGLYEGTRLPGMNWKCELRSLFTWVFNDRFHHDDANFRVVGVNVSDTTDITNFLRLCFSCMKMLPSCPDGMWIRRPEPNILLYI